MFLFKKIANMNSKVIGASYKKYWMIGKIINQENPARW